MGMVKKSSVVEAQTSLENKGGDVIHIPSLDALTIANIPVTKVEAERVTKQEKKVVEKKAVAYGRELSDYELQKDRKIGVAGVVQAVIGSEWYATQAALTDLKDAAAVKELRQFAKEEAEYWLGVIREKSE